ncbi:hypothetical protein Q4029_16540 [Acinetobacter baumannii]|uniref:Uncharacterized protein n=1 Tax=Acinetobacter baumannii TaxID=470 RepID=A0A1S2G118_ACIBA|nr:hypothetical protein [Acinetobacter baumannii]AWO68481.1 hypothetical protein [Acinetobacter baumannii]MCE6437497.1 hypothetical protein [Acinetobacter baumannii]MCZ0626204.1 hypothetical protein [Acinetobacter baumannii]MCZ0648923.1 hypothetical protein [Acinetobacter baumannii]MDW2787627.1 hypothetical protein [Acinetobacter baumannii]
MNTKLDSTSKVFLTLYGAVEVLFLNLVFIFFAILASYTNYIPKTEALIFFLCGINAMSFGKSFYLWGLLKFSKSLNQFPFKELGILIANVVFIFLILIFSYNFLNLSFTSENTKSAFTTFCLIVMIDYILTPYTFTTFKSYTFISNADNSIDNAIIIDNKKKGIFNFVFSIASLTLGMLVLNFVKGLF